MRFIVRLAAGFVGVVVLAGILVTAASWQEGRQKPPPAATVSPGLSATPSTAVAGTVIPTSTAPPGAPPAASTDAKTAPVGYASSCAGAVPWGQQVSQPFVCIERPASNAQVSSAFVVWGYAGGSFENNVVIQWQVEGANGALSPPNAPIKVPVTYVAPDVGMPGQWQLSINLGGPPPGTMHMTVYFESPKDGSRVAERKRDFKLQ